MVLRAHAFMHKVQVQFPALQGTPNSQLWTPKQNKKSLLFSEFYILQIKEKTVTPWKYKCMSMETRQFYITLQDIYLIQEKWKLSFTQNL